MHHMKNNQIHWIRSVVLWQFPCLDLRSFKKNKNRGLRSVSVFMVPDFNHMHSKIWELENGRLSDRYRIATDTGCILSNHICFCCIRGNPDIMCITTGSAAVNGSVALCTQDDHRAFAPCHPPPRAKADGRELEGREEDGDCNLTPAFPWNQDRTVLSLGHQRQMTPHPLHQQVVMTTVSIVNHTIVSAN